MADELRSVPAQDGHVRLFAGTATSGEPVYEVVPAVRAGQTVYEILGSPGLATGCAAGDRVRVDADGRFEIITRGGNVCLVVYPPTPPDDDAVAVLREAFGRLAGQVEAPVDKRFIVVTVPVSAGFPAIEAVVVEWTSRIGAEWYYGNVYDEDDRPIGWWEKDTRI
ncbi:protein of unknown function [Allokutzneria albata]|uniref:DUF4265 domain-containing protein n=1 Tax=Allokutzneria albata TaxID=211114 RepID=A0A1G9S6B9_ALLAB|nr:protein of unknown function [Allokutzneria albata]